MSSLRNHFEQILESAGVQVNGSNPWDITVHNEELFSRISRDGTVLVGLRVDR
jgi:cyclopropane-fatty-acyl-phospholipid synthase